MRRAIALLALALALTGCNPETGGGGGSRDPVDPLAGLGTNVKDPDWVIELRARDKEEFPAKRAINCLVTGFANGKIVQVKDDRGQVREYKIEMTGTTPINLGVTNAFNSVDVIEVYCAMTGSIGESLRCRTRSRGGGKPALLPGIDFNIIDKGTTTFCTVNISARS